MAIITISEAARLTGKSRQTLHRHIAIGKLSKYHTNTNMIGIDTLELLRVYNNTKNHSIIHNTVSKTQSKNLMPGNTNLNRAFIVKNDEFYTCYQDINTEIMNYKEQLQNKIVFCNCDNPFKSAFFRFFVINFKKLRLKRLISTCYSNPLIKKQEYHLHGRTSAYKAIVTQLPNVSLEKPDGSLDFKSLFSIPGNSITHLSGNGDFRSDECIYLLKQADVIITNPPFSLFRDYISLLKHYKKKFIILGNMNASTYKEVFPLFRDNEVWYGESIRSGDRKFYVPNNYPLNAAGCGIDEKGHRYIRVKGVRWFTNLDCNRRSEHITLSNYFSPKEYLCYENYNAIEVKRTQNIPIDYKGIMGVPITFLDKYNPNQFEIIMLANGNARTNVSPEILTKVKYQKHPKDRGGVGIINNQRVYARILIRRRSYE